MPLLMVAVDDIGVAAAAALLDPASLPAERSRSRVTSWLVPGLKDFRAWLGGRD